MVAKKGRRNFLRNTGATLLGGAAFAGCGPTVQPQPAKQRLVHLISHYDGSNSVNDFLASFPRDIPGAKRVETQLVNNAKRCLIYIKNIHPSPRSTPSRLTEIEAVQDDIELILLHLIDNHDLRAVYQENEIVGEESTLREYSTICERRERVADDMLQVVHRYEEMLLQNESDILEQGLIEARTHYGQAQRSHKRCREIFEEAIRYSAINRLHIRGLLDIQATATREIYDRAIEIREHIAMLDAEELDIERICTLLEQREESDAKRERYVLQQIVRNGDGVGVTVFGGDHDFGPDIREWNVRKQVSRNPDIFSLIEITPQAYAKYRRR